MDNPCVYVILIHLSYINHYCLTDLSIMINECYLFHTYNIITRPINQNLFIPTVGCRTFTHTNIFYLFLFLCDIFVWNNIVLCTL